MIANAELSSHGVSLGIIASVLQLVGYALYNYNIHKGHASGNGSSWAIWTFGSLLNLTSYHELANDFAKEALPFVCSICCILTFVHIWKKNGFGKPEKLDWWILGIDIVITFYWFVTSNDEANLLYQTTTILSFAPMIIGIAKGKEYENPLPWVIWTVAYEVMIFTIVSRWEKWQDVVYPVVCFVLHLAIAIITCLTPPARKSG
jgi:uncharacterized membrane protein